MISWTARIGMGWAALWLGACLFGIVVCGPAGAAGSVAAAGGVVHITVPPVADAVAVDPVTDTAYVASVSYSAPGTGQVSAIDLASGTVTSSVPVGRRPMALAVNPVTGMVFVANTRDSTISVIDGATDTVTQTISVPGSQPGNLFAVAVNPATNTIYAGGYNGRSGTVTSSTEPRMRSPLRSPWAAGQPGSP